MTDRLLGSTRILSVYFGEVGNSTQGKKITTLLRTRYTAVFVDKGKSWKCVFSLRTRSLKRLATAVVT